MEESQGTQSEAQFSKLGGRMERGYIKLWRKINDCAVLKERGKVFSRYEAWIFIVMTMAQGIESEEIKRGEFQASYRYLAKAWRWDVAKTYRFIASLIAENMLEKVKREVKQQVKQEVQHFNVCNYETYNPILNTNNNTPRNTKRNKLKEGFKEGIKEGEIKEDSPCTDPTPSPSILFEIYESENKMLPSVKMRSQDRLVKCRSRINQAVQSGCIEQYLKDFKEAVIKAQKTPFLTGDNARGWRADFDWITANQTNIYKILEGKYDGANVKGGNNGTHQINLIGGEPGSTSEQRTERGEKLYIPKQM
jgi:hypothetical protein